MRAKIFEVLSTLFPVQQRIPFIQLSIFAYEKKHHPRNVSRARLSSTPRRVQKGKFASYVEERKLRRRFGYVHRNQIGQFLVRASRCDPLVSGSVFYAVAGFVLWNLPPREVSLFGI